MRNGATRQCQNFTFDKEKPAKETGDTDNNLGLCLQQGARGIVEIEARETITRDTTKPNGLRPGNCYHGGLTVLSCSATRGNRGDSPYSHHSSFFTPWNSEHCEFVILLPCDALLSCACLCLVHA